MLRKLPHRAGHFHPWFHSFLSVKKIILIYAIPFILFFNGCAFFSSGQKPRLLFTEYDIDNIARDIRLQEDIVSEFYSTGTLTINGWIVDTSVDIFFAGKKEPLMLKMEISHSWGKPLFYFLIKEDTLEIRDFIEKKQYIGKFTPDSLSRFLPNMDCSPDIIWSFLRGYPHFDSYDRIHEGSPGVLTLTDRKKNIGKITFSQGEGIIKAVSSPPHFLTIKFSDFRKSKEINYAEKSIVEDIKGKKDLILKRKKVIFNKDIPREVFTLKNQPYFEELNLDD